METTSAFDRQDRPDPALIDTCVHCGFCLPACPTYVLWGQEADSPRGRIALMKAGLDGRAEVAAPFVEHFDSCLGCVACVPACPSGVQYGPLIEATRGQIERLYRRPLPDRLFRSAIFALFPFPARLRIALLPLLVYQPFAALLRRTGLINRLHARLRDVLDLAPTVSLRSLFSRTPGLTPAIGARRMRVGLLTGCVQRLVFPNVNRATTRVLAAEGCEVVAPVRQGCCGALALHAGRLDDARGFARRTIAEFEAAAVDVIAVNAAGCGSSMKEYGHLLRDDPAWADRAAAFSARVRDVNEIVAALEPARAVRHALPLRVAYQDACHLRHAQGVRQPPRHLLASIPGLTLVEIAEPDLCCGSAGIYNLVEPRAARQLGDRKAATIDAVDAGIIATANPGCALQLAAAGARLGRTWTIRHPIELLDASIRGDGQI